MCPERTFIRSLSMIAAVFVAAFAAYAEIPRYDFSNIIQTNYYGGIHCIAKDATGYLWCCGHEAVFRYDGYSFENITSRITALASRDNWNFDNVEATPSSEVFIGSNHGVIRYNSHDKSFSLVRSGNIGSLCYDGGDFLWMICDGKPLRMNVNSLEGDVIDVDSEIPVVDKESVLFCSGGDVFAAWGNHIALFSEQDARFHYLASLHCQSSIQDILSHEGGIYVLTRMEGIFHAQAPGAAFIRITEPQLTSVAKKLYCDQNGIIWASSQSGILFYDPRNAQMRLQSHAASDSESLPVSSVWDIYGDPRQGVWISTYGGRLIYTDLSNSDIKYCTEGLPYPIVSSFCQGPDGKLWLGTEGGGLAVMDSGNAAMRHITTSDGLLSNYIKKLYYDGRGHIVVSSFNGGLQYVDANTRAVGRAIAGGRNNPISAYGVLPGLDGGFWLVSPDEMIKYLSATGAIEYPSFTGKGAEGFRAAEDVFRNGDMLYFLTSKGLYQVNERSREVSDIKIVDDEAYGSNNLICFCRLACGDVWFGTGGYGITVLSKEGGYGKLDMVNPEMLEGKIICSMLEDTDSGKVWICCEDGFYSFDEVSRTVSREPAVRLKGAAVRKACFRDREGTMYFGSTNGFVSFTPSLLGRNSFSPRVYCTQIRLNGEECSEADLAAVKHNEVNIEVDLACDSYMFAADNRFAYRIVGLSNEWTVLPQGQRSIQVVNPRHGHYKLQVKAANNSGLWGDAATLLRFTVKPSPLASWWAITLYCAAIFGLIVLVWRFVTNRKLYEQRIRMEKERAEHSRQQALARTKFLTNISHDLKTPLTLLEDPLRRMREHMEEGSPMEKYVVAIDRNVHRISHMISQLLHFREIESQKVVLNNQEDDFVRFARDIFGLFEPLASHKSIEMIFKSQSDSLVVPFDHDVIEKLLSNLCSNAIKYTVTEGMVGLNISHDDSTISLSVVNTGTGIPEDKKDLIFGEFAKLPGQHPNFQSSTGLGLAIVKELVSALGGNIELNSSESRVEFAVSFPYQRAHAKGYDTPYEYDYAVSEVDNLLNEYVHKATVSKSGRKANSVLVVDDDPQMRAYLESNLSDKFNVYTAADGADAIAKADKINPEVIVTDLMMPEMDGFELCKRVREDIRISHISVIILSGLDNKEARLKAMECGANIFMGKPVDVEVLMSQIETMIRSQEEMKEKYSKRFIAEPSKLTISSMDEKLLEKAMKCIEKNMDNFDYDVDAFVSDMAIGRTVMYRKIKDITGMSVKEFIMDIRLKRAVQLIRESDYNISEISMMTGFINPKYFSVCFKRHFDMTPSEYKKKFL